MLAEEFKSFGKHLLKKEIELGDDSLEAPSGSNSQDDLEKVFDSGLSFTDEIESTGTDSRLISDTGIVKSGSESLIESKFIESRPAEDRIDINFKSIPLDSIEDSSSDTVFSQNPSTPSATDE
ncbi:hypothetical protein MKW92_040656, partial [Papaver armeniacum]